MLNLSNNRLVNIFCGKINCLVCFSVLALLIFTVLIFALETNDIAQFLIIISFLLCGLTAHLLISVCIFIYKDLREKLGGQSNSKLLVPLKSYLCLYGKIIIIVSTITIVTLAIIIVIYPVVFNKIIDFGYDLMVSILLIWILFFSTLLFYLILSLFRPLTSEPPIL